MVLKIRLRQQGRTNHLTYRLVVADSRFPRDGKYIENVGHYNPYAEGNEDVVVHEDRVQYWVDQGAQLTGKAYALIARKAPGVIKSFSDRAEAKKQKRSEKRKAAKKK